MKVKVEDLMVPTVVTTVPHKSVGHAREILASHRIHALPVVDPDGKAVGIVTSADLARDVSDTLIVGQVMTRPVHGIPKYNGIHEAARSMRNHRVHHLVVTHESRVIGILSAFDLLQLVEDRRFAVRNARRRPGTSDEIESRVRLRKDPTKVALPRKRGDRNDSRHSQDHDDDRPVRRVVARAGAGGALGASARGRADDLAGV